MYTALWRILPGPWWLRVLILLVLLAAVLTACAIWIFPWIDATFFVPDSVVGGGT